MTWEVIFALVTGTLTGLVLAYATAVTRRTKELKAKHALETIETAAKWYKAGWDIGQTILKIGINLSYGKIKLEEPVEGEIVQHCNNRTDYEFIVHPYDPDNCEHCQDVRQVVLRSN